MLKAPWRDPEVLGCFSPFLRRLSRLNGVSDDAGDDFAFLSVSECPSVRSLVVVAQAVRPVDVGGTGPEVSLHGATPRRWCGSSTGFGSVQGVRESY